MIKLMKTMSSTYRSRSNDIIFSTISNIALCKALTERAWRIYKNTKSKEEQLNKTIKS